MLLPSRGDIVIAYFPQEDNASSDLRPCLALSVDNDCLFAAKITTTPLPRAWTYKLEQGNIATSKGSILRDSWINLRRCEMIPLQDAKRVAASLKPEILRDICDILATLANR